MKRYQVKKWLLFICGTFLFVFGRQAYAEEVAFTVKPELPTNQVSASSGFYDLKVVPGTEQELILMVYNKSDQGITTKVEINPAATSESGGFIYTLKDTDRDESMKVSITDIASTVDTISVPAKGEGKVAIKLRLPKEPFAGIILGGIRVKSSPAEEQQKKQPNEGFSVSNTFAYTIAIRLQEQDELPSSDLVLKSVQASQVVGRNSVKATLANPTPTIIDKVSYHGQVMKKGQETVLHEIKVEGYRVAPNTRFDFPVSWDNQEFEAGTYLYKLKAKSEETGDEWNLEQEFSISAKEAKNLNKRAIDLEKNYLPYIIMAGVVLVLSVISLLICLVVLRKKQGQQKKSKRVIDKRKKGGHGHRRKRH